MEEKLKLLFDYQKFEQNEKLAEIIEDTEKRNPAKRIKLTDEQAAEVYAAGGGYERMKLELAYRLGLDISLFFNNENGNT